MGNRVGNCTSRLLVFCFTASFSACQSQVHHCGTPTILHGRALRASADSNVFTVACDLGFHHDGGYVMLCLASGTFNHQPRCQPSPCHLHETAFVAPANGQTGTCHTMLEHGESCRFECYEGYVLSGRHLHAQCKHGNMSAMSDDVRCEPGAEQVNIRVFAHCCSHSAIADMTVNAVTLSCQLHVP